MADTTCVRCEGSGEHLDPMATAGSGLMKSCAYCKGTGKRVWLLTQNSELRPFGIYNWTLPAFVVQLSNGKHINVCPNAGVCASVCYALNGTYKFPSVRQAHVNKLEMTLYDLEGWERVMTAEVAHPRYRDKWVRIHDGGDFYSMDYLLAWLRIARATPQTRFYCYTKEVSMFRWAVEQHVVVEYDHLGTYVATHPNFPYESVGGPHPEPARRAMIEFVNPGWLPENFLYTYSMGGKEDHLLDRDVDRHADIFPSFEAMEAAGYTDQEGDDTQCVTNENIRVGIIENNIPAFKKVIAGRTFAQMQEERDAKKRSKLERLASDPATAERVPVVEPQPIDLGFLSLPAEVQEEVEQHAARSTRYKPVHHKPDLPPVADDQGTLF